MLKGFSQVIAWGSAALMLGFPLFALYLVFDISHFSDFVRDGLRLPIQWQTVEPWQLYTLWLVTVCFWSVTVAALFFLRRAFSAFAKGELFTVENSRSIRVFAVLVFAQALSKPLQAAIGSLVLSLNHPEGQRMLSITLGSDTLQSIGLSMILWIVAEILITAHHLENENQQFV
jgi:hypothetical protein